MEKIQQILKTVIPGIEVEYYDTIDSTNVRAKRWAKEGASPWSLVIAEEQTLGKGRRGKVWASPKGEGIWMSVILKPDIPIEKTSMLTLVAGLSMCKAIQKVTDLPAKIKWPNDIIVQNKKVCGILTEMNARREVIVGIGVNVNTKHFEKELLYATSLYKESGKEYAREEIIKCFFEYFYSYYQSFVKEGFTSLKEAYQTECITVKSHVKIMEEGKEYTAFIEDLTDQGELLARTEDGQIKKVLAGEVSVRGIYGYAN